MPAVDVFNGDADGICALHQLRLADPRPDAQLLTGVKRDVNLLARLKNAADLDLTVLDISFEKNKSDVLRLLDSGSSVLYIDHHYSGDIPQHPKLTCHIDPDPQTCTSLIVDRLLDGAHCSWSIVGAFGDNLNSQAQSISQQQGFSSTDTEALQEIGILLNYNGYGASLDDLYFSPDSLYRKVHSFIDPLNFFAESEAIQTLRQGYHEDMSRATASKTVVANKSGRVFELENAAWARRVSGVFANQRANEEPNLAHAIISRNQNKTYRISVRAPLQRREGADTLCRQFPTGGGRAAAAGINHLPENLLDSFLQSFTKQFLPADSTIS